MTWGEEGGLAAAAFMGWLGRKVSAETKEPAIAADLRSPAQGIRSFPEGLVF
jgi:hypothetical protein